VTKVEITSLIPGEMASLIPADPQYLFERPPLLKAEDPAGYWKLVSHFIDYVPPKAIIEWIWIRDIVDHTWEILRLPRFRAVIASSKSLFEDLAPARIERRRSRSRISTSAAGSHQALSSAR
jgi:hypothetical protein